MTAIADFYCIYGGSVTNHILDLLVRDAGATIASNEVTIDITQACRLQPRLPTSEPSAPGGYTRPTGFFQFNFTRVAGGSWSAAHNVYAANAGLTISRATTGVLTFTVGGSALATYDPGSASKHHIAIYWYNLTNPTFATVWNSGDVLRCVIFIDKVALVDKTFTTSVNGSVFSAGGQFGVAAAVSGASAASFKISDIAGGYTEWANNVGKVTVKEWVPDIAGTPITGYNTSNKTGDTNAAKIIGSNHGKRTGSNLAAGTTDGAFYYQTTYTAAGPTVLKQLIPLTANLLATGDVLCGVNEKVWYRHGVSSKLCTLSYIAHDGTNLVQVGATLLNGPTSYADGKAANALNWITKNAPDGSAWASKLNAYLNGCQLGTLEGSFTDGEASNVDALVIEGAVVLSGDDIVLPSDVQNPALAGLGGGIV